MFKFPSKLIRLARTRSILSLQWKKELFFLHVWCIRKLHINEIYGNIYIIYFSKTLSIVPWFYFRPIKKIYKPFLAPFLMWTGMHHYHLLNQCWSKLPDIVLFVNNGHGFCMIIKIYLLIIICYCSHYYTN